MLTIDNAYIVGVTGDWHQDSAWAKVALDTYYEYGATYIFQLGDFGFSLDKRGRKFLHHINETLTDNKQKLLVTLGNHENYVDFKEGAVPVPNMEGWVYVPDYPHVLFALRGARLKVDGVEFVSLGGANSIDKFFREENISWWAEEQISPFDVEATVSGGLADVMLTHDCPTGVDLFAGKESASKDWFPTEIAYAGLSRKKVLEATLDVKPKLLLHGHYHFYADHTTRLSLKRQEFELHSIGLGMNRSKDNIAILALDSLTLEVISPSLSALKLIRQGN